MAGTDRVRWAIVGVGVAGLARGRAISADPDSELVAVWRGKNAERFPLARVARDFEDAVRGVDAVAISSPSEAHAEQVEKALKLGLHVVCEYPLAPTARKAVALLDLARSVDRVLHVEHIELLHAPQAILRAHTRRDPVSRIDQYFARNGDDGAPAQEVATQNLARVHRMLDLCGPVRRVGPLSLEPGRVAGTLEHTAGAISEFVWEQSPYLQRLTRMTVRTTAGEEWRLEGSGLFRGRIPQTLVEADPLFEQDHRVAMGRIRGTRKPYLDDRRLVHGLQVLRRIVDGRVGEVGRA